MGQKFIALLLFLFLSQVNCFRNTISITVILENCPSKEFHGVARNGINSDRKMFFKIKDSDIVETQEKKSCEKINQYFLQLDPKSKIKIPQGEKVRSITVFAGMLNSAGVTIWRSVTYTKENPKFLTPFFSRDNITIYYEATPMVNNYVSNITKNKQIEDKLGSPSTESYSLDIRFSNGNWHGVVSGNLLHYDSYISPNSTLRNTPIMTVNNDTTELATILKDALLNNYAEVFITEKKDNKKGISWSRVTIVEAFVTEGYGSASFVTFGFYVWNNEIEVEIHIKQTSGRRGKTSVMKVPATLHENIYTIRIFTTKFAYAYHISGSSPPDFDAFLMVGGEWCVTELAATYKKESRIQPPRMIYESGTVARSEQGEVIKIVYKK